MTAVVAAQKEEGMSQSIGDRMKENYEDP